ncbi:MAG: fibronectin type III-like domain-contianing protein, partial [Oscillospiraceae bacterium]|nr:fibronectin type III-like domain-contianing protein [Oscillospiraceae bacterium]
LYIKDVCEHAVPNVSLCGFKRIHLKKGEKTEIEIALPKSAFEAVDSSGIRKIFGNSFTLYAGVCQPDELSEKLSGTKCVSAEITVG